MDRRSLLKNLALASGSLILLPSWMEAAGISNSPTHSSSFSPAEQTTLANIADTIIPAGNSIGALNMEVDKYLQKLFDDCYETADRENIKNQLKALEASTVSMYGKSFSVCSPGQKLEALQKWSASEIKAEKDFFNVMKREIIYGFSTSKKVMQDYLNYKVAPGHYIGCVNI